jgi:hypothetical protein
MSVEKAKKNYLDRTAPRKMNCCESVAHAFKDSIPLPDKELQNYSQFGSGRAPEGYCGAVYAAKRLLEKSGSQKAAEFPEAFKKVAGSAKCREIRSLRKISCLECVEKAAKAVEGKDL